MAETVAQPEVGIARPASTIEPTPDDRYYLGFLGKGHLTWGWLQAGCGVFVRIVGPQGSDARGLHGMFYGFIICGLLFICSGRCIAKTRYRAFSLFMSF